MQQIFSQTQAGNGAGASAGTTSTSQTLLNRPSTSAQSTSAGEPMDTSQPPQAPQQATRSRLNDSELATKLEQMHELGLWDDELNVRALQITEGDVEASVSLILEGVEF